MNVRMEMMVRRRVKRGECIQNILYEILRKAIKILQKEISQSFLPQKYY